MIKGLFLLPNVQVTPRILFYASSTFFLSQNVAPHRLVARETDCGENPVPNHGYLQSAAVLAGPPHPTVFKNL